MKNTISILASLFILFANAQTIKPIEDQLSDSILLDNVYYKDTNHKLQNCVGTWEYSNGSDYFKITFNMVTNEKESSIDNYKRYNDKLYCKYIYKKNGTTIYDNYGLIAYPT